MQYRKKINISFALTKSRSIQISTLDDFKVIPRVQGVYVFHSGPVDRIWKRKENIFYIGAANRETLRTRIKKHTKALTLQGYRDSKKMRCFGEYLKGKYSNIYVSYYPFLDHVPDYMPFLYEGYLMHKYEDKFGSLPKVNTGRR